MRLPLTIWPIGLLATAVPTQQHQHQCPHYERGTSWSYTSDRAIHNNHHNGMPAWLTRMPLRQLRSAFGGTSQTLRAHSGTKPWRKTLQLGPSEHHLLRLGDSLRRTKGRSRASETRVMGIIISSGDGVDGGGGLGGAKMCLWLDMSTSILPAQQTLKALYDDLRDREESKGHTPEDSDWIFRRIPNPVGAVLYADEPAGRAAEESEGLIAGGLRCFVLHEDDQVTDVSSGNTVGVALDPAESNAGVEGMNAAVAMAATQGQDSQRDIVLLRGVRPSAWEAADMRNLIKITICACAGSGKTLVVSIKSVGQLHDTAMAVLSAAQTKLLGQSAAGADDQGEVALLIEPTPELWEAGIMYL